MNALPTKTEIRKLFPDYVVSMTESEVSVPVAQLTMKAVPALIITCVKSRNEKFASGVGSLSHRYSNHPVEMELYVDAKAVVNAAGYTAVCRPLGLVIIPSDVVLGKY